MGKKIHPPGRIFDSNFRIASDMTQKELADKCGLNESTIRNYELGNRCPSEITPDNKDGELCFKFEDRLPSAGSHPQEDLDNFRKMVEYWARLRDKLEDNEI